MFAQFLVLLLLFYDGYGAGGTRRMKATLLIHFKIRPLVERIMSLFLVVSSPSTGCCVFFFWSTPLSLPLCIHLKSSSKIPFCFLFFFFCCCSCKYLNMVESSSRAYLAKTWTNLSEIHFNFFPCNLPLISHEFPPMNV